MKPVLWTVAVVALAGCGDFQKAMDGAGRSNTVNPTGIASSGDVSAVQNATSGGSTAAPTPPGNPAQNVAANPPAANPAQQQPVAQPQPAEQQPQKKSGSILGKTTGKISDVEELRKNPKMVEVDNKITGNDPLTVTFNAYVSASSRVTVANFKHQMDILKAADDRNSYPTYKEAVKLMKQMNFELAALPPYRLYGYDSKTGGLIVFEDKAEKIRLYKQNDIPLDETDKQYDTP